MKLIQYALLGALLGAFTLSGVDSTAVDSATFDKIIELYKKHEATRKDVINAYDQLADKRLGDQLLQVFLQTNIRTLRSEEAQPLQNRPAIPAPVNRGRAECTERGCNARTRISQAQAPYSRPRRPSRSRTEERRAKRLSPITTQEQEREDIEIAQALSLSEMRANVAVPAQNTRAGNVVRQNRRSMGTTQQQEREDIEVAQALSLSELRANAAVPAQNTRTGNAVRQNRRSMNTSQQQEREDIEVAQALSLSEMRANVAVPAQNRRTGNAVRQNRRLMSTAEQQEREDIEIAQALSLSEIRANVAVPAQSRRNGNGMSSNHPMISAQERKDIETAQALSLIDASTQDRELAQAIKESLQHVPVRTQAKTGRTTGALQPSQAKPAVGTTAKSQPTKQAPTAEKTPVQRPLSTTDILERAKQAQQPSSIREKRTKDEPQPRPVQTRAQVKSVADILAEAEAANQRPTARTRMATGDVHTQVQQRATQSSETSKGHATNKPSPRSLEEILGSDDAVSQNVPERAQPKTGANTNTLEPSQAKSTVGTPTKSQPTKQAPTAEKTPAQRPLSGNILERAEQQPSSTIEKRTKDEPQPRPVQAKAQVKSVAAILGEAQAAQINQCAEIPQVTQKPLGNIRSPEPQRASRQASPETSREESDEEGYKTPEDESGYFTADEEPRPHPTQAQAKVKSLFDILADAEAAQINQAAEGTRKPVGNILAPKPQRAYQQASPEASAADLHRASSEESDEEGYKTADNDESGYFTADDE